MTLWTENLIQVSNAHKIQIDSKGRAIFLLKKSANLDFRRKERRKIELPEIEDEAEEEKTNNL